MSQPPPPEEVVAPLPDPLNPPAQLINIKAALLRTMVPVIVGLVVSELAALNITWVDQDWINATVTVVLTSIITAAYYIAVRVLEHFKTSKWGWLLGYPVAPTYAVAQQVAVVAQAVQPEEVIDDTPGRHSADGHTQVIPAITDDMPDPRLAGAPVDIAELDRPPQV